MFHALEGDLPVFAHVPLLLDAAGQKLSKRTGGLSLSTLRDQGVEPMAVNALMARLGTSDAVDPAEDWPSLLAGFDLGHFSRGAPRLDATDLFRLTEKCVHTLSWEQAKPRLIALGCERADESFWLAVRANLKAFVDAAQWYKIIYGPMVPVREDEEFLGTSACVLPQEPWGSQTWHTWTTAISHETGRKGKALFLPLRLALTGLPQGPELHVLLPLLGRRRVLDRLGVCVS